VERGRGNQDERSASERSVKEMDKAWVRIGYVDASLGSSIVCEGAARLRDREQLQFHRLLGCRESEQKPYEVI
jgi:hypothetical protein